MYSDYCGKVDGISVPIPHFGCLFGINEFKRLQEKLEAERIDFIVKPQKRYEGKTGEQLTIFVFDFRGNQIEFKEFSDNDEIFAV